MCNESVLQINNIQQVVLQAKIFKMFVKLAQVFYLL